ncbi:hypothetical protein V6N13_140590 [Hibiscus sabdariffa]
MLVRISFLFFSSHFTGSNLATGSGTGKSIHFHLPSLSHCMVPLIPNSGPHPTMDVPMDPIGEDNPLEPIEGSKHQRVLSSASGVSKSTDSNDGSPISSAGLVLQASRLQ